MQPCPSWAPVQRLFFASCGEGKGQCKQIRHTLPSSWPLPRPKHASGMHRHFGRAGAAPPLLRRSPSSWKACPLTMRQGVGCRSSMSQYSSSRWQPSRWPNSPAQEGGVQGRSF